MKVGRVQLEKEAKNFLLNKVGEPHVAAYVNHIAA